MIVKELIAFLEKEDPETPVLIAIDEEGNDFKPVDFCEVANAADGIQSASGAPVEGVVIVPRG